MARPQNASLDTELEFFNLDLDNVMKFITDECTIYVSAKPSLMVRLEDPENFPSVISEDPNILAIGITILTPACNQL